MYDYIRKLRPFHCRKKLHAHSMVNISTIFNRIFMSKTKIIKLITKGKSLGLERWLSG